MQKCIPLEESFKMVFEWLNSDTWSPSYGQKCGAASAAASCSSKKRKTAAKIPTEIIF
jgi:hypothetical protein